MQISSGAVGNLISLSLGLGWRRWWVACGALASAGSFTTKESGSVVFSVFDTIADTVIGAGKDGVEEAAFTGELARLHGWSTEGCAGNCQDDEKLGELSHR
jgi:hypothetical protein